MSLARVRTAFSSARQGLRYASTEAQAPTSSPPPPFASSSSSASIESTAPPAPAPPAPSSSSPSPLAPSPSPAADSTAPSPLLGRHVPLPQSHGVHVATLHLRSYTDSIPDLQFFTNFALRSARALGLPTSGAVALPTRTSLYTVPRSPFAHKKSQQNFWRKEHKRAIKVFDGNEEVVNAWLAYLRNEALPGVGMKAQVFTYREPGWGKELVSQVETEEQRLAAAAQGQHGAVSEGGDEVERLAKELEAELRAGIEEAEGIAQDEVKQVEAKNDEPVVEAAKEVKEVKEKTGEDVAKEVPVKGEA
ncbi:hypothetical protein JCM8097_008822 [Rhodosporidiobolus ruineniae]